MIAVDTSALMAILLLEPQGDACRTALEENAEIAISAGTLAEALIVSGRRGLSHDMLKMVDDLKFEVSPVTSATARRIGEIYSKWGKGAHRAGLNFGDCFAYDLARERSCGLLFIGDDFAQTDIQRAL